MLLAISTSLMLFISSAGVIQAVGLAGILYFHPGSDGSVNLFLSLHILSISILMLAGVTQYLLNWQTIIFHLSFQFLIGPFLYLYVRSFKQIITWRKAWPHFVLFAIIFITAVQSYLAWVKRYPLTGSTPREVLLDPYTYIRVAIRNVQTIIYFIVARKELKDYQRSIRHIYSETSSINLDWVKSLLAGFLLIIISLMVVSVLIFLYPEKFNLMVLIVTMILTPYIYVVTIKGMGQHTLWQIQGDKNKEAVEKEIVEAQQIESMNRENKEKPSLVKGLPETKVSEIANRIISLMESEKLYEEPELTLQMLSDKLGVQSYQASQVINEGLKRNFYELVNGYRVDAAKRLLLDPKNDNYTILSVGFEAGFNSKTTFHSVFKKFTGLTPTEYRGKNNSLPAGA